MRTFHTALRTLAILFWGIVGTTQGQTHFYIDSIGITPIDPTSNNGITISLSGVLSSTGAHITSTSHQLIGQNVHITVNAADPGGGDVLVPHTEEVAVGTLSAGTYSIVVNGDFILDLAPDVQHAFTVSGGPDCEVLTVQSIQWATFTDTAIFVHVTSSTIAFSYPAFVLLGAQGDTLAVETPNFFAIGTESWHTLRVRPGATIPTSEFDATLHLWTGFFEELACTWELPVTLCPAQECVMVRPYIRNNGNGHAVGTYGWTITDQGNELATGEFTLTEQDQHDEGGVCLPPGHYTLSVEMDQEPTGGQLDIGLFDEGYNWGPTAAWPQFGSATLPFDVLVACTNGTNGIGPHLPGSGMIIAPTSDGILVSSPSGETLGSVRLYDGRGALVAMANTSTDRLVVPLTCGGVYLIQALGRLQRFVHTPLH